MKTRTLTPTASAIFGSQHAVTVDRQIAQVFFGVSGPTAKYYDQAEALLRELAAKFGWKPKGVQADPWVAWNAQGALERDSERQKSVLFDPEPIKVVLPHGEMELHSVRDVLSREEYYELTRAVGLVEAGTVMSHHGLRVG